ncbi:MAG: ATP-binding protein [Proteobacteria bacterium]|nr:ATP-binding protein [Pseudomonadota bacterium]
MSDQNLTTLVTQLRSLPHETEWVEFKENKDNPEEIGEYISALSNSAALLDKPYAYMVWGVEDKHHDIVGTVFHPHSKKINGEELENWLRYLLAPRIDFNFKEGEVEGHKIVILEIPAASHQPIQFKKSRYIRVGSYKKKLIDCPEKERSLWRIFLASEPDPRGPSLLLKVREPEKWTQSPTLPGYTGEYRFHVFVENTGTSSAKEVSGVLLLPPKDKVVVIFGTIAESTKREKTSRFAGQNQEFRFLLPRRVHKGENALALELILKFHRDWREKDITKALIQWKLFADDMEQVSGTYTLSEAMQKMIADSTVA